MATLENMENMVETSNGMGALGTTLNECVNLFFQIGAMRGKSKNALLHLFSKAYNENPLVATKVLFWVRDVREGAGERQIFKDILTYLAENNTDVVKKNLSLIPFFGRWDDVLVLVGTSLEDEVFEMIKTAIQNEIMDLPLPASLSAVALTLLNSTSIWIAYDEDGAALDILSS